MVFASSFFSSSISSSSIFGADLSVPGAEAHQKVRVCWVFRPVAPPAPIAVRLSASGYCS